MSGMKESESSQLDRLIEAVLASSKYKSMCSDVVRNIGARELARQHNLKEAIKATKNKLHQVGGAYFDGEVRYGVWLDEFKQACLSGDRDDIRQTCISMMRLHASTRERLPMLEEFYTTILGDMPPIRSVLDVACGLHPLAIPWMPLAENAQYYAYDIYQDMMAFLNEYLRLMGLLGTNPALQRHYVSTAAPSAALIGEGHAQACDVLQYCPSQKVDVAFLLKVLPCLEQVDKSVGPRLLETISADALVVSFPARSLGGRHKGMVVNYEARFWQLVAGKGWSISRFEFASELVFLIRK